jgi:sirohydrochlorin ferrochelatase
MRNIMKALVLIAHGSRRHASNEEVIKLAGDIARALKDAYPIVQAGFLELAEPLIPDAIDRCIQQGASDVVVVPYFLSAGRHVHEDIPAEVDKARAMHADVPITILPHIGGSTLMPEMIRQLVRNAPE